MNKIYYAVFLVTLLLFLPCISHGEDKLSQLNIDAGGAEHYIDLLKYIKENNPTFFKKKNTRFLKIFKKSNRLSENELQNIIRNNKNDKILNSKINSLLNLPIYKELSRKIKSYKLDIDGIEAYRETFYRLPWERTNLTGGVDENMIAFIKDFTPDSEDHVANLVSHFSKPETSQYITDITDTYLTHEITKIDSITTYIYFDGNRGSFREGRDIYLDLRHQSIDSSDYTKLERIIAHELHHVYYGMWLNNNYLSQEKNDKSSERIKELKKWQGKLLLEGTARFCDFEICPELIKTLYFDKDLISTLFAEWEKTFLGTYRNEISLYDYKKLLKSYDFEYANKLLKGYLSGSIKEDYTLYAPYRPVIHYYLGYYIFHTILHEQGIDTIKYVMIHPEELLKTYNDSIQSKQEAYRISDEMVKAWRELLIN